MWLEFMKKRFGCERIYFDETIFIPCNEKRAILTEGKCGDAR
jgi:hypothetical protein